MPNKMWVAGVSGNPGGRKKGAKRTLRTTIARFLLRNGSLKELQANYLLLKAGRERLDFILKLMPYHIAPVSAEGLSEEELQTLYDKLETKIKSDVQGQAKKAG